MTNELAIRILTGDVLGTTEQTQEAVTMAVRALSKPNVTDTNVGDTISRQAAYEVLTAYYHHATDIQHTALHDALSKVPSAERHGRWIVKHGVLAGDGIYGDMGECSVCGLHLRNYEWDYCPNCGAKMDEDEETSNATQHTECVGDALDALVNIVHNVIAEHIHGEWDDEEQAEVFSAWDKELLTINKEICQRIRDEVEE